MKKNFLKITVSLLAMLLAMPAWAATTPKREHRSVWVTTAWRMCWPTDAGTSSSIATSQKNEAIQYLDLLKENGFNCVYFQVRGMSDAMYKSSYEPWSSYVSGTRGSAPAYDPLAFWIEECHKRGMELFAWVNPYRYESSVSGASWTGANDYRTTHPEWILEYNNMSILNPGLEAVQTRIVDVCREIVGNYDVDGLVFDDYFYLNSIPNSYDADTYSASGSSLSQADWRRDNVNTMVRKVYNMVQSTKPYVKFGISPAGVSKTSASKYGISTSSISSASDWQYSQIYSDPLAWLGEGTVDFISPQIYWITSHSTNPYGPLSKWWSDACADVFGRHFYSSHSISFLDGANTTSNWSEVATQVQYNRDYDGLNAPGCVFFGSRDLTGKRNSGVAEYLKSNKFQNIALPPCLTWKSSYAYNPGTVSGLTLSGTTLSWNGYDNMRYVVYAVPTNITISGEIPSDYIIGNPYSTTFDVSSYTSGYKLGVSVFDRYGNEYEVTWLGDDGGSSEEPGTSTELERTTINTPSDGSTVQAGFTFGWTANSVSGVSYRLEVATSNTFSDVIFSATTGSTSYSSSSISFTEGATYYWRIITSKEGYTSSTSWVGSFTIATSGSSTPSTPTDVVKDPSTYNTVNGYSIESLWMYSVNTSNFPSQLGGDQRGMAACNGNVYIIQRDNILLEFSGETGEYLRSITLTGDCSTDANGTSLAYKCQDLFVDAGNHLCVSSMTLDCSTTPLTICTIDLNTGATTRVFNMTCTLGGRIDFTAVRGDVTQTGCEIWAAVANSNYVYRWTRNASGYWAINYTTVSTYYPSGSATTNSTAPRIMPISNTQFILDGHNSAPALYTFSASGTATYNDGFGSNTAIAPSANNWNGVSQATLNGMPIFAYVSGIGPNTFTIVTNPSSFKFASMSKLWTVPANGLGSEANSYVTSKPTMVNNSDGSVTLYIYTPNNGLAAYKLTASSTVVTPQLDAVSLSTPIGGTTAAKGFSFGWSSISGATYTLEVSKSSTFATIDFMASTTSNSYSSSNFNLAANTTYYWRVKASKDGYLSSTSGVASFKTAQEALASVTLTSPIGGATVEDGFTFNWSAISGATYTLEISAVATFASIMYSIETTSTSYSSASLDFMDGTKYYWRVKADTDDATESVSATESFTTKQAEVINPEPNPSDSPTEGVEYDTKNNLSIKNLWIYSIQKGNFHEELGRDQRGMAAYNGKVYISERSNGAGYLLEFDGNTGKFLRKITLSGEYSSLSDGYTLGYPCNDVFVDGGGHLCVANMITSSSASSQLNISIVDVETGATTRVFETGISNAKLRIDNCMAWGDLTKAGSKVYAAPSGNSATSTNFRKRIYCWTRNKDYTAGVTDLYNEWNLGYNTVRALYPSSASNFGNAPRVLPVGDNRIIVDGSAVYPTLYNYNTSWNGATSTIEDSFDSNSSIKPAGMLSAGMCVGAINGRNLYIYSFNDDIAEFHNFAILLNPNDFSYADMEILWKIPQAGLGNVGNSFVSSIPATQKNADGSLNLYIYTPSNGLAAYRIDDSTTSIQGIEFNSKLSINAYNKTIHCSEAVNMIKVFTPAGVKVAEGENCQSLNVANLAKGIYLVRATNDGETISESIVIK
ncbi:MAG: family 10 glycosylhydrolase [Muribaculaceae bacterium]|nr:family 10 glycosylhydrolase [Muribaculaceae bacterium]